MKRNSITSINKKSNYLAIISDRLTNDFSKRSTVESANLHYRYLTMISKAATHEILRLVAIENKRLFKQGFSEGYDAGFETALIAANCDITKAQDHYDQEPTTPATDTSNPAGVPGQLAEPFEMICNTLKNIPGSGYEFLNNPKP